MQGEEQMTYTQSPRLFIEFFLVGIVILIPFSVHAGIFSYFFDTAEAQNTESTLVLQDEGNMQLMPILKAALHTDPNPAKGGGDIIISEGALVPHGDIDGRDDTINTKTNNGEISLYVVREGDTLSQIASMFDVSAKTVLWANDIMNPSKIRPGDTLVILPITGVRHVVKSGDTIKSIAKKYDGDVDDILAYNQLASATDVHVGDTVVIPDGTISSPTPTKSGTSNSAGGKVASGGGSAGFVHPLPGSVRSQGIHGYNGVDLAAPVGTPILAAAAGEVIVARNSGWNGGYGNYVVVKHANGTQTLYAHMSKTAVVGGSVVAGEVVGYVGNTGRSTGSHLHFEVRGARNPF